MASYLEFMPVKSGVARAGAVAIPFNYLYRQDEPGYMLRQSRPTPALITWSPRPACRPPRP